MYGYMMLKTFESLGYTVEEPTLYPLLRRLETRGFIKSKWELSGGRPKKFYIITAKGKDARRALLEIWRRQIDILNTLLKEIDHV
jgi:DNA-binding PadR family transcriptional regulator